MSQTYSTTTRGVLVQVRTQFLPEQSAPGQWVWAYTVRIENQGTAVVQLLRRTWRITDARGHTHVVEGSGVIGKQPRLQPGQAFEYTSGTPLPTPSGFMTGTYHMIDEQGDGFDAAVPSFSLDSPDARGAMH